MLLLVLGPLAPARAQITESPETVKPGEFLLEMDGVTLNFDREAGSRYRAVGLASTIVTAGLTRSVDLQVGFNLFLHQTYESGGARQSHSGLGDLALRTKWTFWRDDRAGAAAAVIPYVKLPTNTGGVGNKSLEGGLIVPWAMNVPGGFGAGAMLQWDVVRNHADNGYDSRWSGSAFLHRELTRMIVVYGETAFAVASTGLADWTATLGGGVLCNVTKRLQLDYELSRGLNRHATDWQHVWRVNWAW